MNNLEHFSKSLMTESPLQMETLKQKLKFLLEEISDSTESVDVLKAGIPHLKQAISIMKVIKESALDIS